MAVTRLSITLLLCAALAACGGPADDYGRRLPTAPGGISGTSQSAQSRVLLGRWRRILLFIGASGDAQASETTWEFRSDGTATRTVVATNISQGFSDTLIANARWSVNGSTVTISFVPPDSGIVQFSFIIDGSALTLDGRDFSRIS